MTVLIATSNEVSHRVITSLHSLTENDIRADFKRVVLALVSFAWLLAADKLALFLLSLELTTNPDWIASSSFRLLCGAHYISRKLLYRGCGWGLRIHPGILPSRILKV